MEYSLSLSFDKETETRFNDIITRLACSTVNHFMVDNKIPPHVTIAMFNTSEISKAEHAVHSHIQEFAQCELTWASIGTFVPQVLFAAPVVNQQLINACATANSVLEPVADSMNAYYQVNSWVPHTTLATKLTMEELTCAFEAASRMFTPLRGCANRLVLVECNPYRELHVWQL